MPLMDMKAVRAGNMRLVGKYKTRDEARRAYDGLIAELNLCLDHDTLDIYVISIGDTINQYKQMIPFLWFGDTYDFLGLEREIEAARLRITQDSGISPDDVAARLFVANE